MRLLVVTSPPPVKRLPELFLALLDSGAELVFSASPEGFPAGVAEHPGASTVQLPLVAQLGVDVPSTYKNVDAPNGVVSATVANDSR